MIGPASTMPSPPPMPTSAEIIAIPWATRSRGNSSRMIEKASGNTAPPMPWITRAKIITPIELASAARNVPSTRPHMVTTSIFFLPNMSPSRPRIGVATLALSR